MMIIKNFIISMGLVSTLVLSIPTFYMNVNDINFNMKKANVIGEKIEFEKIYFNNIPENLSKIIKSYQSKKGFICYQDENKEYTYIAVLAGTKNSGGYSIDVTKIENINNVLTVTVIEKEPGPDDIVTQALTYPYAVVKIKGSESNINVKSTFGGSYQLLYNNCKIEKTDQPLIGVSSKSGKLVKIDIKNNLYFITIQDSKGNRSYFYITKDASSTKAIGKLKTGDNVKVSYALGTPKKYLEKYTAMPLRVIEKITN